MASALDPTRHFSPRRRPSSTALSPSRSASISRPSSTASSATSTTKKRPHADEYLNDLPEDITMVHNLQSVSPPSAQSPVKSARRIGSVSSHGGQEERSTTPDGPVPSNQFGGISPDRTIMPAQESFDQAGVVSPEYALIPASVSSKKGSGVNGGGGVSESGGGRNGGRMEENECIEEEHEERESSPSTDDLLVQLPDYDWVGFMGKFEETLKEIGTEKELLSKEYDMWDWMYEIWSSSRDRDDTRRLSREMATIIQWTKLKEADLERAREAHTQSMLAISSVLGIVPKNATPPPKKKR